MPATDNARRHHAAGRRAITICQIYVSIVSLSFCRTFKYVYIFTLWKIASIRRGNEQSAFSGDNSDSSQRKQPKP